MAKAQYPLEFIHPDPAEPMSFQKFADRGSHHLIPLDHFSFQHFQNWMGTIDPGPHGDDFIQNNRMQKPDVELRREGNLPVREQAVCHGPIQK